MSNTLTVRLSRHAETRLLERTSLAGEVLLERFTAGAVFWLPVTQDDGARHALVYCATTEAFFVVIVFPDTGMVKTILTAEQWESSYMSLLPIWRTLTVQLTLQSLTASKLRIRLVSVDMTQDEPSMLVLWSGDLHSFSACFNDFERYRTTRKYPAETTMGVFAYIWEHHRFQDWLVRLLDSQEMVVPATHELFLTVGPSDLALEHLPAVSVWAPVARRVRIQSSELLKSARHLPVLTDIQKLELTVRMRERRALRAAAEEKTRLKKMRATEVASAQEASRARKQEAQAQALAEQIAAFQRQTEFRRKKTGRECMNALSATVNPAPQSSLEKETRAAATRNAFDEYVASLVRKRQEVLAAQPPTEQD